MEKELNKYLGLAKDKYRENKKFAAKWGKRPPRNLDIITSDLTAQAFEKIDCLECGNCCKTLGPRLANRDIDKLARHLRIKPSHFIEQYVKIDEDKDYVFNQMPCPFIAGDNFCTVYEHRPRACREFPHTERRRVHQILPIIVKNSLLCPVAYEVLEGLKHIINGK